MVVTTPFLDGLRKLFQTAQIDVLCSQLNRVVLTTNPDVNRKPVFEPKLRGLRTLMTLRSQAYDMVVDLNHSVIWRDMLMIRLINPIWAISVYKVGRYGVKGEALKIYKMMADPSQKRSKAIAAMYLDLLKKLGGQPPERYHYKLAIPNSQKASVLARNNLAPHEKLWLLNSHGGRASMRLRDVDLREMTLLLLDRISNDRVLWMTSPDDFQEMQHLCQKWFRNSSRISVFRPGDSVMDTLAVMSQAKALVSPDTSLVHMAASLEIPSLIVYADEKELFKQWKPEGDYFRKYVFSKSSKSLEGYSSLELMNGLNEMIDVIENLSANDSCCSSKTSGHAN